jgi:hypothetical protein
MIKKTQNVVSIPHHCLVDIESKLSKINLMNIYLIT